MSGNGSEPDERDEGVYEQMLRMAPRLREDLIELDDKRDQLAMEHQAALRALNERKRKIEGMLKHMGQDLPPRQRRATNARKSTSASSKVLLPVIEMILDLDNDTVFTVRDIITKLGDRMTWRDASTYSAINRLRSIEFIGLVGQAHGDRGHTQRTFRVLDRSVGERLQQELEAGGKVPEAAGEDRPAPTPSPRLIQRVVEAIRQIDDERFSGVQVKVALGDSSAKSAYRVLRYLTENGVLEQAGTENPNNGPVPRQMYRWSDVTALEELIKA